MEWIDVKSGSLPELLPDQNFSANVLAWCNSRLMVMCSIYDNDQECIFWCNCYGDINGDGEIDDDYQPTHWMPLPPPPTK